MKVLDVYARVSASASTGNMALKIWDDGGNGTEGTSFVLNSSTWRILTGSEHQPFDISTKTPSLVNSFSIGNKAKSVSVEKRIIALWANVEWIEATAASLSGWWDESSKDWSGTMIRTLFALATLCILLIYAPPTQAATYAAADCSRNEVGNKVVLATDGDTVTIPPGDCSGATAWTTKLSITKGIKLLGAGQGVTIIGDNVPKGPCTATVHDPLVAWTVNSPNTFEMSGMTIVGVMTDPNKCLPGHISLNGTATSFRVHHITFNPLQSTGVHVTGGQLYGLIDHLNTTGYDQIMVSVRHTNWGGSNYGDGSWAAPLVWGGANVIFIEDNTATDTSTLQHGFVDCYAGGRYVSRHNQLTNYDVGGSHGTETTGRIRGCRQIEAYENDATWTFTGVDRGQQTRGGTSVVYNNRITVAGTGITAMVKALNLRDDVTRVFPPPWDHCDGNSQYDQNATNDSDTDGISHAGYRCVDQPGAGTSNDLGGTSTPPTGWVGNILDPFYVWGNTLHSNTLGTTVPNNTVQGIKPTGYSHVVSGRDYYNDGPTGHVRPGYTAYTYPHPLQGLTPSSLTAPTNLTLKGSSASNDLTLIWQPIVNTDLKGYNIYYSTTSGLYGASFVQTTGNKYSIGKLPAGTYYFTVTSSGATLLESAKSNEVTVLVTAPAARGASSRSAASARTLRQ